ncbi:MAG: glycerol-3-phosphate 1-O-acyltransferase PlsY [Acidobacteria bacterium]|nr:glycerol-3-phosphate 1-O-acyltransferase PlsY [Acidobacteriota bacterium]
MLILASYLLGGIPFSYLIVRWRLGEDVRKLGSGNAGATNVLRTTGVGAGLATLILDVLKGSAAVAAGILTSAPSAVVAVCGLAAVMGHVFPVYLRFRGGKGVATAAGALGLLSPFPMLVALGVFVIVVIPTRFVALASISAAASYPLALAGASALGWISSDGWLLGSTAAIAALIIYKHRDNIRRLRAGTEPRLEKGVIEKGAP